MIYAFIADIHSNLEALEAVLAHAERNGVQRRIFLGDFIGYGADPYAVIERIQRCVEGGDLAVLGNHDVVMTGADPGWMNQEAQRALEWSRGSLTPPQLAFLRDLPYRVVENGMTCVHASATQPEQWFYVRDGLQAGASMEAAGTPWVFCGHVHDPALYYAGLDQRVRPFEPSEGVTIPVLPHRRWLSIVGSCGQPRDRMAGARYALFDREHCMLRYFRVPYDHALTASKIRAAGLAERFALHVEGRF